MFRKKLDVTALSSLESLSCGLNRLAGLDLSGNPVLEYFYFGEQDLAICFILGDDDVFRVDFSQLVGEQNVRRITMQDGVEYDPKTGIASFTATQGQSFSCSFDTGSTTVDPIIQLHFYLDYWGYVTYDPANGEEPQTFLAGMPMLLTPIPDPVKEGYRFDGWYLSDEVKWDFDNTVPPEKAPLHGRRRFCFWIWKKLLLIHPAG